MFLKPVLKRWLSRDTHSQGTLPASRGSAPRTAAAKPPQKPLGNSPRLILAVRNRSVRRSAPPWFESVGFEVIVANDGDDAVRLIREQRPAIALADPSLRHSCGQLMVDVLRGLPDAQTVPLLALCSSQRDIRSALMAGAADVVRRPFHWGIASRRAVRIVGDLRTAAELSGARAELDLAKRAARSESCPQRSMTGRDEVSGLPDREQFEAAVDRAVGAFSSGERQCVVTLIDIDHFAAANRLLGRARANAVLQQFAQQLAAGLRSEDLLRRISGSSMSMVARLDGDLFGTLLTGLPTREEAIRSVHLLLDRVTAGTFGGDSRFSLSASAGAAIAPADGRSAEELLLRADLALEEAKARGGVARFHDEANHRKRVQAGPITRCLATALASEELRLHYQPLFDGRTGRVCAAEALLRWESKELGPVPSSTFVPLAEESGLMVQIGTWVLMTACRQLRAWIDQGLPPVRMAVNVSLCQLLRSDLVSVVRDALRDTKLDPHLLELELSERGVLRSDPDILRQLREIKELGVRLSLDDFGTGNSAIAYVKQFPIDVLKIDQSFIRGVTSCSEDAAITRATIAMAQQLGLDVVAEGVEERGQIDFLRLHGCEKYQGFLFSPPVSAAAFGELLERLPAADAYR